MAVKGRRLLEVVNGGQKSECEVGASVRVVVGLPSVECEKGRSVWLTSKSDVYSFGVVLMELITAKPAMEIKTHSAEIFLAEIARDKIEDGEFDQFIDNELWSQSDAETRMMITSVLNWH
ncbi:hypothetical protein J5N97_027802 [Dioscorea zingiberensis]|uniref:Serine-threonine/tyrosine-protein kinase catalytic domain-containing protein n=1 Tax=Dioscorea zingiberensis TaxID=325984 RepID=A0A9D5BXZ5_9LILI|nr:hypothetical protein J5N97_027802 [Dioscorea zingiberensis]